MDSCFYTKHSSVCEYYSQTLFTNNVHKDCSFESHRLGALLGKVVTLTDKNVPDGKYSETLQVTMTDNYNS